MPGLKSNSALIVSLSFYLSLWFVFRFWQAHPHIKENFCQVCVSEKDSGYFICRGLQAPILYVTAIFHSRGSVFCLQKDSDLFPLL